MPSSRRQTPSPNASTQRAIAWGAVVLVVLALLGLRFAPSVWVLWIVLLIFAAASIPQVFLIKRLDRTRNAERRDD